MDIQSQEYQSQTTASVAMIADVYEFSLTS